MQFGGLHRNIYFVVEDQDIHNFTLTPAGRLETTT